MIILRDDIDMSVGKKCVQCCHASLGAYKKTNKELSKTRVKHQQTKSKNENGETSFGEKSKNTK